MTDSVAVPTGEKTAGSFQMPQDQPPAFINSLMKWMLTTPGIQAMVGQGVALLSFTGRRTGNSYTIPVSYHREDEVVTVVTKKARNWWHNFESPAEVGLRLAGRDYVGKAELVHGDAESLEFMTHYLEKRPIDAKAYGLAGEEITRERVSKILPHIVLVRILITSV